MKHLQVGCPVNTAMEANGTITGHELDMSYTDHDPPTCKLVVPAPPDLLERLGI